MLTVLGLDGLDAYAISNFNMKHLQFLCSKYSWKPLKCVGIPNTASSWTTTFTGKMPEEHGVYEFAKMVKTDEYLGVWQKPKATPVQRKDIKARFIWEIIDELGFKVQVLSVPCTLYFESWKCKARPESQATRLDLFFPHNKKTLDRSITFHVEVLKKLLKQPLDLFIHVLPYPDKFYHLRDELGSATEVYFRRLDNLISQLHLEEDFILLSDHGRPCGPKFKEPHYKTLIPAHEREGIIISNLKDLPTENIKLFTFLHEYFHRKRS